MSENVVKRSRIPGDFTAKIVAAYVAKNKIARSELPTLIAKVHVTIAGLLANRETGDALPGPTPAQIRRSITPDALISFVDGKTYKSLKRHLAANGHTPKTYRERYNLPVDYPMVAPSYSVRRSAISRQISVKRGSTPARGHTRH